ncbi:hypothetical protein HMPREF0262_01810 [Clostridium sp. ATCC 29733]|nr:hypothetical protein HMPREF0262_01810 [Clostridium sp. ATCC 29733]
MQGQKNAPGNGFLPGAPPLCAGAKGSILFTQSAPFTGGRKKRREGVSDGWTNY